MQSVCNVGQLDRIIRLLAGIGLMGLALGGVLPLPATLTAAVVAATMLITGALRLCPLYSLLGITTQRAA